MSRLHQFLLLCFMATVAGCKNGGFNATVFEDQVKQSSISAAGGTGPAVTAKVLIKDQNGNPVSGVLVAIQWEGNVDGTGTAYTGADGVATFSTPMTGKAGPYSARVISVSKSGSLYDSGLNHQTFATATL